MFPFVCFLFAFVAVLGAPARSCAFYDPATFAAPPLEGGGGGRFFTGSPADGQTCETCHTGGERPSIDVEGLPARYVPGGTYELLVSWSAELGDVGAMLEVTDQHGNGVGSLALAPNNAASDEEFCEPRGQQILGTRLFDAAEGRAIAGLGGCGASALRVQWTAPKANVGLVWLSGAVVVSDLQGDVEGDGVTTFLASVPPFGHKSAPADQGCSVLHGAPRSSIAAYLAAFTLSMLLLRRKQRNQKRLLLGLTTFMLVSCNEESPLDPGPPHSMGPVTIHAGAAVEPWDVAEEPLDSGSPLEPLADSGEDGNRDAGGDAQAPPPPFQLRVTTLPQGGDFAPKNVGAIWVEDADGKWVKTLARWATVSLRYLSRYVQANRNGNTVDAVTGATLAAHEAHVVTWNLKDRSGALVPDGTYRVRVEVADSNKPGQMLDVAFVKGPAPQTIVPSDTPYFVDVELRYAGE